MDGQGFSPNVLDLLLVLMLVYVVVRGWRQGALWQVASLGGFALGLLVGLWAAPLITGAFFNQPGPATAAVTLAVVVVAALVGQGIGIAIGLRLRLAAARIGVGKADQVIGVGVGAAWLALVVWLLAGVLAQGPVPAIAQQIRGSQVVQALDRRLPPPPALVGRIAAFLDDHGFPQVFAFPGGGTTAPPVPATAEAAVQAAAAAGQPSTVQVLASGCGATLSAGSGFVVQPGFVVTNAHVVAGYGRIVVRDAEGDHSAVPIAFDPELDIAVLAAPDVTAQPIPWVDTAAGRGTEGATLGFPGGQSEMVVQPATVRASLDAIGRDIYGQNTVRREVLALSADVEQGDSGGPFVTSDGRVAGVVFAADPQGGVGYALTAAEVQPLVERAVSQDQQVVVGACRF
jgi:S1-C subfamily serine protease